MIEIEIPGRNTITLDNLCLDYNGTIAVDGKLIDGIAERIECLQNKLNIYVLTADTYGTVKKQCENMNVCVHTFPNAQAGQCKEDFVQSLHGHTAVFGNGYNDIKMFDKSDLSIAIIEAEGMCSELLSHSDICVRNSTEAFDLLIKTDRMRATLRN